MTVRGVARGKVIELEEPLPYPEGQPVSVSVQALGEPAPGSAAAILKVMQEPPFLTDEDVDELERAIQAGKLPVTDEGVFDREG